MGKITSYRSVNIDDIRNEVSEMLRQRFVEIIKERSYVEFGRDINISTTITGGGGIRAWFKCPKCRRNSGILYFYKHLIVCRKCANLSYERS